MKKVEQKDKELVMQIITNSYRNNPSVLAVIKNDNKKEKRIRALAEYVFNTAYSRNGIYISTDKTGVAICYPHKNRKNTIKDYGNQIKLMLEAIGFDRVLKVKRRASYIEQQRPVDGNYLYFWFFGVTDEGKGRGAAIELRNKIFNEAYQKQLPIYLETSVLKNKIVYERFGFEVYHTWKERVTSPEIWFMKKTFK